MMEVMLVFVAIIAALTVALLAWAVIVNSTTGVLWALVALALILFELTDVVLLLGRRDQQDVSGFSPALLIAASMLVVVAFVVWSASCRRSGTGDTIRGGDRPTGGAA